MNEQEISNWGGYPKVNARIFSPYDAEELSRNVVGLETCIARGLGRSYGDSSLSENIISTTRFNRFINFDDESGIIRCESGVVLWEILEVAVPRGWFLPVTPGTKYVTIGGAISSDVHGKNHHKSGSFGSFVREMKIVVADGNLLTCSAERNSDLFEATKGGMGLTGIIIEAEFQLIKIETPFIRQETIPAKNLDEIMELFQKSADWTYSVAWIDCLAKGNELGKSILFRGEHATKPEVLAAGVNPTLKYRNTQKLSIPFDFPDVALNGLTVKTFNNLYYAINKGKGQQIVHFDPFFYPLDSIGKWNRIYGKRGFLQYQFVLPMENSRSGLEKILNEIVKFNSASFLAVLKLFGEQESIVSFPKKGFTLALDFPITKGVFQFLDRLDQIVLENDGRFYFTKDSRLKGNTFKVGYENLDKFREIVKKFDTENKFASSQSNRLELK